MLGMWDVRVVGYLRCGMFGTWNVGMWDVGNVGCSECAMLGIYSVRDEECSGCGIFGM